MEKAIGRDSKENIREKLKKVYHVSFRNDFVKIIDVESYKAYNILTDKDEYINKYDNDNTRNEEEELEEEDEDGSKFDINKYNPIELDKTANHDPNGFSKTKCIII